MYCNFVILRHLLEFDHCGLCSCFLGLVGLPGLEKLYLDVEVQFLLIRVRPTAVKQQASELRGCAGNAPCWSTSRSRLGCLVGGCGLLSCGVASCGLLRCVLRAVCGCAVACDGEKTETNAALGRACRGSSESGTCEAGERMSLCFVEKWLHASHQII